MPPPPPHTILRRKGIWLCSCQSVLSACNLCVYDLQLNNPLTYPVLSWSMCMYTSILVRVGSLLIFGSLGQRSRSTGSNVPKPFPINNSRTPQTITTFFKLGPHIHHRQQRTLVDFGNTRSKVKVSGVNVPNPLPINNSRTP